MSRSTHACLVVGTLLGMAAAASACRGCRTEAPPATPAVRPDPSGQPPNIKMDYGKALEDLRDALGRKPGDCKPGTGERAQKRPDGSYPPCEPTAQYLKRLEDAQKRGRAQ
jgi:hypothetical protein